MLSGALNLRQLQGAESTAKAKNIVATKAADIAQQKVLAAQAKSARDQAFKQEEQDYKRGTIKYSPVRTVEGRQVRDKMDNQGNILETQDLGDADPRFKPNLFEVDGRIVEVPVGSGIPANAKPLRSRTEDLTPYQKVQMGQQLAKVESWLNAEDADAETLKGYVDYFNANTTGPYKYAIVPGQPPKKVPFLGFDIPGTGTDATIERQMPGMDTGKIVVRTGIDKRTGRKVNQYSDGSTEYAD